MEKKECKTCGSITEPMATCSCGDNYCAECLKLFSEKELSEVIESSSKLGHIVTLHK